jgi:ABC-2 type transport system ATP-binding protein
MTTAAYRATVAAMQDPVVSVDSVTKRFGGLLAVDGLTFHLDAGTVTGFLGPNGAGKTTTLRILLGLTNQTSGTARVFGMRYHDLPDPIRRVGAVLEANDFHPGRKGRDHLRALAYGARIGTSRVDEVLRLVELETAARRPVKTYSLGMRQRLALAAALLGDPELLVLDEPANGLDPEGVHWLRDFLRAFAAEGKTVFVSSHVLAEVAQTVDRVVIINKGRLVTESPLDELTARVAGAVHVRTPQCADLEDVLHAAGPQTTRLDAEELLVAGASSARVGELALVSGIVLYELVQETTSLEEVFLDLTTEVAA